ncbi:MAG TPA: MAPEG family protein [Myxococcaceae bacterium]|nr:MAPEG family protein [Myxococcaceae bacterium]
MSPHRFHHGRDFVRGESSGGTRPFLVRIRGRAGYFLHPQRARTAHAASLQVGYRYTATAREARPPLIGVAERLERALRNFLETFPLFAVAAMLVEITSRHSSLSTRGAELYLAARIVYLPLYAAAVPLIGSLVWNVATVGIMLMLVALV